VEKIWFSAVQTLAEMQTRMQMRRHSVCPPLPSGALCVLAPHQLDSGASEDRGSQYRPPQLGRQIANRAPPSCFDNDKR